jgi:hypothetical protein
MENSKIHTLFRMHSISEFLVKMTTLLSSSRANWDESDEELFFEASKIYSSPKELYDNTPKLKKKFTFPQVRTIMHNLHRKRKGKQTITTHTTNKFFHFLKQRPRYLIFSRLKISEISVFSRRCELNSYC